MLYIIADQDGDEDTGNLTESGEVNCKRFGDHFQRRRGIARVATLTPRTGKGGDGTTWDNRPFQTASVVSTRLAKRPLVSFDSIDALVESVLGNIGGDEHVLVVWLLEDVRALVDALAAASTFRYPSSVARRVGALGGGDVVEVDAKSCRVVSDAIEVAESESEASESEASQDEASQDEASQDEASDDEAPRASEAAPRVAPRAAAAPRIALRPKAPEAPKAPRAGTPTRAGTSRAGAPRAGARRPASAPRSRRREADEADEQSCCVQ